MKLGVLALQGDFREHCAALSKIKLNPVEVRMPKDLEGIDGLVIPGGESTTIGKLMVKYGLDKAITKKYNEAMLIYGTCAGAILLAKDILHSEQPRLELIDISISRNSYGRQIDSFETEIDVNGLKKPFPAIFIRAPQIKRTSKDVEILSMHNRLPVLIRTEKILISTFHPELSEDTRIHEYFIGMIKESKSKKLS
jgi:5'-phosphate synthase pdxT subunit